MEYLLALAILALAGVAINHARNTNNLVAAFIEQSEQERAYHAAQVAELCNRIQLPERTAHVSISEQAPPSEPPIHPDLEEELSILGEV